MSREGNEEIEERLRQLPQGSLATPYVRLKGDQGPRPGVDSRGHQMTNAGGTYWYPLPGQVARSVEQLRERLGLSAIELATLAMALFVDTAHGWERQGGIPAAVVESWERHETCRFPYQVKLPVEGGAREYAPTPTGEGVTK